MKQHDGATHYAFEIAAWSDVKFRRAIQQSQFNWCGKGSSFHPLEMILLARHYNGIHTYMYSKKKEWLLCSTVTGSLSWCPSASYNPLTILAFQRPQQHWLWILRVLREGQSLPTPYSLAWEYKEAQGICTAPTDASVQKISILHMRRMHTYGGIHTDYSISKSHNYCKVTNCPLFFLQYSGEFRTEGHWI